MKKFLIILAIVLTGVVGAPATMAVDFNPICSEGGLTENQRIEAGCTEAGEAKPMERVTNLINVAIGLTGVIAVVVVVFGGQRYLTSAGDPSRAKQAKDMIMYGVIGIVVAVLAWAIINFVITGVAG